MNHEASKTVTSLSISNFKSIEALTLTDCRRINVFIGKPNVGKSNILEALAMFDAPYLLGGPNKSLRQLVRAENPAEIFHNGNSSAPAQVAAGDNSLRIQTTAQNGLSLELDLEGSRSALAFSPALTLTSKKEPTAWPNVLAYFFPKHFEPQSALSGFLLPPAGANLMDTVAAIPTLKARLAELFHGYGLKMVFDSASREIKAMRENGLDMFLVPFNSLADSLQRLIFYKAAIESNYGKTICLEEPEAQTFPPYISAIVGDILQSKYNQFFLSTHSPYVMNALLESAGEDLAVFVVDMTDGNTVARRLSDAQLQQAYDNGIDMFFNIETLFYK